MNTRMEHDTMGEIAVPAEHHWGAQTQRSLENFKIGGQRQPREIITAFAYLKEACAWANASCGKLTEEQADAIAACFSEYSRRVLKRSKSQRVPIREQLKRAAAELARQPSHKKERAREAVHEDR